MLQYIIIYIALFVLAMLLLRTEKLTLKGTEWLLPALLTAAALGARLYVSARWAPVSDVFDSALTHYITAGGFWGIKTSTSPLPLTVQYGIALFSPAPESAAVLFGCLCVFFQIVGAWGCQRVVQTVSSKALPRRLAFLLYLLLPSGILMDAQCVGWEIGFSLLLLAAGELLSGRTVPGCLLLGVAVSARPTLLPVLPVFLLFSGAARKKLLSTLYFLLGWFIMGLPAVLLGRKPMSSFFWPSLNWYFSSGADWGSPGIFAARLLDSPAVVGLILYAVSLALCVWFLGRRSLLRDKRGQITVLALALLLGAFLLPWSSWETLFGGEIVLLALCCTAPGAIPPAIAMTVTSATVAARNVLGLSLPYASFIEAGGLTLAILLLLVYAFGRPVRGTK